MLIIDVKANGIKIFQGETYGSAVPIVGDLQKLIASARRRREPVYQRLNGQYTKI